MAPLGVRNEIFNVADTAPARREEVVRWLAGRLGGTMPLFDGVPGTRRGGEPMPDRIISSGKIRRMLGWLPQYPDYRAGYEKLLSP
jgi:nucleoside-diphosphate-sugar epimerase